MFPWGFPSGSDSKKPACDVGYLVQSLDWEDPLKKGMATQSSILAWRLPWTEEEWGAQFQFGYNVTTRWHF